MTPDALGGNRILIVDDDERISQMLQIALEKVGYTCDTASNAGLAGDRLREKEYELVFLDINMPGKSGMEYLPEVKQYYPNTAVIMLTGVEDLSIAVSAMQQGAYDYVNKPVRSLTELTLRIEQALSHRALVLENKAYQENLEHMVQDRTAELEQRMRELNGLNGILRTELNQNIGKKEDHTRLEKNLAGYGSQLLDFVQQLTSISSGPSESVRDPGVQKAITDCSSQLGELAYRMLGTNSPGAGTGS